MIESDRNLIKNSGIDWTAFDGKTVLFTGGYGFQVAYMVESLILYTSCKILVVVRNLDAFRARFKAYLSCENLVALHQDVCDPIHYDGDIDYIVHAASPTNPNMYERPLDIINPNVLGTQNTLKLAVEKSVKKYLFFSTCYVYGVSQLDYITEQDYGHIDVLSKVSCYPESKRLGERMCLAYHTQHHAPCTIVRPFHTYGPGIGLDDGRISCELVKSIVQGKDICLNSDGLNERSFCYLADAVIAYFTVLLRGCVGESYNVGDPDAVYRIRDIAQLVIQLYPEKNLSVTYNFSQSTGPPIPPNRIAPNVDKLKALGWSPKVDTKQGFYNTIQYFI